MPTLLDAADRAALVERCRSLSPESERRWGSMSAQQMVCHCSDQLRVALGEIAGTFRYPAPVRPLLRLFAVHLPLPVPKGIPTVPEMRVTEAADQRWQEDLDGLVERIERVATTPGLHPHPAFGRLNRREWGKLGWKHLDHHLRQFGV